MNPIESADLFAGGGGTSDGLVQAAMEMNREVNLVAINHDKTALATHQLNHPWAKHLLTEVEAVKPSEAVPEGRLDILVASPECIYHSRALGGKPKNDQSRSSAWYLERWIKDLEVKNILVENVPEFIEWGPLDQHGMPIRKRRGDTFRLWVYMFKKHGYNVDWKILNAADYGDPTTRKRLFVRAAFGNTPISWPEPTHGRAEEKGRQKWVGARDVIDWSLRGKSIFDRKKPLSQNTLKRIVAGLNKFSSPELKPFIVLLEHSLLKPENRIRDIDLPLPTVTGARGGAIALAEPFLLPVEGFYRGNTPKSIEDPIGTVTQRGYGSLVSSFIYQANNNATGHGLDEPLPTITTTYSKLGKIDAFILSQASGGAPGPIHETVQPHALIEPFLISYYGKGGSNEVASPVPTVSTKDRFALIQPEVMINGTAFKMEILYRMLTPRELASAMSFPKEYQFVGNRTQVVRQIGNAVAVGVAKSLVLSMLSPGNNHLVGGI